MVHIHSKKEGLQEAFHMLIKELKFEVIYEHSLKTVVCIGVIRSSSYIGERIEFGSYI